jgi:hypothetical protein
LGETITSREQINGEQDHPIILSEVEEVIVDDIPSYREILTRTPFLIYDRGEFLKKPMGNMSKEVTPLNSITHRSGGQGFIEKGVVRGGIEKDFSPLKTRSARRLENKKQIRESIFCTVVDGLRALREQKSLERVKK